MNWNSRSLAKTSLQDFSVHFVVFIALQTVNENASIRDRIEFLNEASVMK